MFGFYARTTVDPRSPANAPMRLVVGAEPFRKPDSFFGNYVSKQHPRTVAREKSLRAARKLTESLRREHYAQL